jgi:hypothetical protein
LQEYCLFFKKGDKEKTENYRPISNLCSMTKVYEKLLLHRAIVSMVSREILVQRQLALKYKQNSQMLVTVKASQP